MMVLYGYSWKLLDSLWKGDPTLSDKESNPFHKVVKNTDQLLRMATVTRHDEP